jgi:copper chaperone CopZ
MKKLFVIYMSLVLAVIGIQACGDTNQQAEKEVETKVQKEVLAENKAKVEMKVEGMVCAMGCAKYIEEKVADLDGIVISSVNFEEGTAQFEFDKTQLGANEIESYINDIHDGQYKASIVAANAKEEVKTSESEVDEKEELDDEGNATKKSLTAVKKQINLSFPKLFTYFMKQLR